MCIYIYICIRIGFLVEFHIAATPQNSSVEKSSLSPDSAENKSSAAHRSRSIWEMLGARAPTKP